MTKDEFFILKARYDSLNLKLEFDEFDYTIIKEKDKEFIKLTDYKGKDKDIKIPDFIDIIATHCFRNKTFKTIDLSNVFKIEYGAFLNTSLSRIVGVNVNCIDEFAFQNSDIVEFIGDNIKSIHYSAFEGCKKLDKINLSNCTLIGKYAFKKSGLKEVKLDTKYIKSSVFDSCKKLSYVNLNCDTIVDSAFLYCNKLKNIYINKDVRIFETEPVFYRDLMSKLIYK